MQGPVRTDGSRVVARSDASDAFELSDQGGVAFVDLVANAQLAVLVVAHAEHLAVGSEQQSVEDAALHLPDPVAEVDQDGSGYFLGPVHPQLAVFVGTTHEQTPLAVRKPTVHRPA